MVRYCSRPPYIKIFPFVQASATSDFFGDNQGCHELAEVTEQAVKHNEETRLRMDVHTCGCEVYILYSLLFVRKMDPRPIYFGFWCLMTNTTKLD